MKNTHARIAENAHKGFITWTGTKPLQSVLPALCQQFQRIALTKEKRDADLTKQADARDKRTYVMLTNAMDAHPANECVMKIALTICVNTPLAVYV